MKEFIILLYSKKKFAEKFKNSIKTETFVTKYIVSKKYTIFMDRFLIYIPSKNMIK